MVQVPQVRNRASKLRFIRQQTRLQMQMLLRVWATHAQKHMGDGVEKKNQVLQKRMSVDPKDGALYNLVEGLA